MPLLTNKALQGFLEGTALRIAVLWRIEREDAVNFYFTDHNKTISFLNDTYTPLNGMQATAKAKDLGLAADNQDFLGILSDTSIKHDDLRAGLFKNAKITEYTVDWRYPWQGAMQTNVYWITTTLFNDIAWEVEVSGITSFLDHAAGNVYSRTCTWNLGDVNCKKVLTEGQFTFTGTAVTVIDTQRLQFQSDEVSQDDKFFDFGKLTWTSGLNNGFTHDIRSSLKLLGVIKLFIPTSYNIVPTDTFTLVAGCDKLKSTCIDKFSNIVNHIGFDFIPGFDALTKFS